MIKCSKGLLNWNLLRRRARASSYRLEVGRTDFAAVNQTCGVGEVVTGIDPGGMLACGPDQGTTYNGLDFAVSGQACGPGRSLGHGLGRGLGGIHASLRAIMAIRRAATRASPLTGMASHAGRLAAS